MKSIQMLIVVRNKNINPSSYYRIIQYLKDINYTNKYVLNMVNDNIYNLSLKKNKFLNVVFKSISYVIMIKQLFLMYIITKYNKNIVIYIQRETIPKYIPKLLCILLEDIYKHNFIIWDFDDNIFLENEISKREKELLLKYSNVITLTSSYLKNLLDQKLHYKVILMPTTDGSILKSNKQYLKKRLESYEKEINLIWLGSRATIFNLKKIIPFLDKAARILEKNYKKKLYLYNVSNEKISMHVEFLTIKDIVWARENYVSILNQSHIGLMPLEANEYSKGKGGFKIIQYFSSGIPVIASAVGYNVEIMSKNNGFLINPYNNSEWVDKIVELSTDIDKYSDMAVHNKITWEKSFSYEANLKILNDILAKVSYGDKK